MVVESFILILAGGGLIFIPLYINSFITSLHIMGSDWDLEIFIIGNSMQPTLNYGDFVCVEKINASLIETGPNGDIIAFERPQPSISNPTIIVHRAINKTIRNNVIYLETKGDNNESPDNWSDFRGEDYTLNGMISERLLIGKVVGVKKDYAVIFPVTVMALIISCLTVTNALSYAYFLHRISKSFEPTQSNYFKSDEPFR
jgi:signal peptidase I